MTDFNSPTPLYDFFRPIQEEFISFMLGDIVGSGKYRAVYQVPNQDDAVYKIERPEGNADKVFSNVTEWNVWKALVDTPAGAWLAPCMAISRHGNILVQKRTMPIRKHEIPDKLPYFLDDCHDGNFGLIDGRVVCHDYGFLFNFLRDLKGKKTIRMVDRKALCGSST